MRFSLKRWRFIILFLIVIFFCSHPTHTRSSPLSLRASVGAVHLPLHDWSNLWGSMKNDYYEKNNPNIYYAFSINYALGKHHSINLGTELIKTSASLSSALVLMNYLGDTTGFVPLVIRWRFQGIPVTLGYEYKFQSFNQRFSPIVGIGMSYFISQVEAEVIYYAGASYPDSQPKSKRTGNGYGFHTSFGLMSQLNKSFYIISQARYRYSNGMAFSGSKDDIKVEFTGFDFSVGIGWTF